MFRLRGIPSAWRIFSRRTDGRRLHPGGLAASDLSAEEADARSSESESESSWSISASVSEEASGDGDEWGTLGELGAGSSRRSGGVCWGGMRSEQGRNGYIDLVATTRHAHYSTATTVLPLSSALLAVTRSTPSSSRAFTLDASIARGNHTVRSNCEFTL